MFKAADGGKAFCEELVKGFPEPVKILECIFAMPPERWEEKLASDKAFFAKNLSATKYELQLADPSTFTQQVQWANVVYLRGGETARLMSALAQTKGWSDHLNGKTVAGSSAGADALSKYYYCLDHLKLGEGLGLVSVKVLVHYQSNYNAPHINWDKAYAELQSYQEKLPVVTLHEGEFKVIEE